MKGAIDSATKPFAALSRRWKRAGFNEQLGWLLVAAFILRLFWIAAVPVEPVSDSVIYATTAENIAVHGVYGISLDKPFSYWPVGTAAIYAGAYNLFGVNAASAVFINLIASMLLVYTTALLTQRWFDERAGILAAYLLAVWPSLIMFTTIYASEIFFALFVNLALLAWRPDARRWFFLALLSGAFFAAAAYVRPVALLIPFIVIGLKAIRSGRIVRPALAGFLVIIATAAVIAPWSARNTALHGEFVLISTNGGPNLWMGNNPDSTGAYMPTPDYVRDLSEIDRAKRLGEDAKQYMRDHPARTAALFVRKLVDTHIRETIAVVWNAKGLERRYGEKSVTILKVVAQGYWTVLLLAGLVGVALILRNAVQAGFNFAAVQFLANPALLFWGYYAGVHAVIVSQDRYHFPSIPFIAMLAAFAFIAVRARFESAQMKET